MTEGHMTEGHMTEGHMTEGQAFCHGPFVMGGGFFRVFWLGESGS